MFFWYTVLLFFIFVLLFFSSAYTWVMEWTLFFFSGKEMSCVFFWDMYSYGFLSVVSLIASMIFFYSYYYMDGEGARFGFSVLLVAFVISMMFLITSPSMAFLLLGWDGLGLTSYLLVVYYSSSSSSVAGMLTFLTNRLGDVFFLLAISFMVFIYDWDSTGIPKFVFLLSILMMLAFVTKSAQVPFSSWLPAAMAAPTPVSSLVHSSTLVTAGVFLFIRFSLVFQKMSYYLLILSTMTLLLAGLMANYEWDLKKLIAFSTLSQLGFMMVTFSLGLVAMSFFHLITHALFKASLFMSAGVLIHSGDNSQEFRNSFNFSSSKTFITIAVMVCLFCLSGIPFTSGFFSKDMILDSSLGSYSFFFLLMCGVSLTIMYSFRFYLYGMKHLGVVRNGFLMIYENNFFLLTAIWILIMGALVGGFFMIEMGFSKWLFMWITPGWKIFYISFIMTIVLGFFSLSKKLKPEFLKKYFFSTVWYLNKLFNSKMGLYLFFFSKNISTQFDTGWLESLGPQGIFSRMNNVGMILFRQQSFVVSSFFFFIFLSYILS